MFSREYCKTFQRAYFEEHLPTAASVVFKVFTFPVSGFHTLHSIHTLLFYTSSCKRVLHVLLPYKHPSVTYSPTLLPSYLYSISICSAHFEVVNLSFLSFLRKLSWWNKSRWWFNLSGLWNRYKRSYEIMTRNFWVCQKNKWGHTQHFKVGTSSSEKVCFIILIALFVPNLFNFLS